MKYTTIIFTTLLAVASVEATAVADPAPNRHAWNGMCYRAGEYCAKLKRAADAAAEVIAGPQSCDLSCGETCSKAKRDALALAEATAEAFAAAAPETHPCHAPGAPCSKAKREALGACEQDLLVPRAPGFSWHGMCWRAGELCPKLKRAAEVVAEAIAQPDQDLEAESEGWSNANHERALDDVNSLLDKILFR